MQIFSNRNSRRGKRTFNLQPSSCIFLQPCFHPMDYFLNCESQELSAQIDLAEDTIQKILGDTSLFIRFGSESQNIDSGSFWPHNRIELKHSPLSDRVEKATVQLLERVKTIELL